MSPDDRQSSLWGRIRWEDHSLTTWLGYYRYISWLATSVIYFAGPPAAPVHVKAAVSFFLLLEAIAFVRVYGRAEGDERAQRLLVLVETGGLVFILMLTGGLDSPFLWYVINPIFLATTLAPPYLPWAMVLAFISLASVSHRFALFTPPETGPIWPDRSQLIIMLALTTLIAQLYDQFIDRVSHQAAVLEKQIEYGKALYEAMEAFSHRHEPQDVANLFASYGKTLTGADQVILWLGADPEADDPQRTYLAVRGSRNAITDEAWTYLNRLFEDLDWGETDRRRFPAEDGDASTLISVKIRSDSRFFGVLSAFFVGHRQSLGEAQQTLSLLAGLCASSLQKHIVEATAEEFLLMEEKDRIASEIHDSVTQNLFGLVYGLESLARSDNIDPSDRDRIRLCQRMAQKSMIDLRQAIYALSSLKSEREPFLEECQNYLDDLARLNEIQVDLQTNGRMVSLSTSVRNALYRIIREATGNAIRHGHCSRIQVILDFDGDEITLTVSDDGRGFDVQAVESEGRAGLGLVTMRELARTAGGRISIDSLPGSGTAVSFACPAHGAGG